MSQYLDQLMKDILGPVSTPQMSPVDTLKPIEGILGAFMDQGPAPQMSPLGGAATGGVGQAAPGQIDLNVTGGSPAQDMQTMIGGASNAGALTQAAQKYKDTQNLRTAGLPGIGGALINIGEMGFDAARTGKAREELAKQMDEAQKRELEQADGRYQRILKAAVDAGFPPQQADSLAREGAQDPKIAQKFFEQIGDKATADDQTEATRSRNQRVEWAATDEGQKVMEGMSPAERRIFLATGQQINKSNVTNVNTPPPKDHIWKTDEDGNQFLEVIPGSPTHKKEVAEAQAMQNNWRRMTSNATFMLEDARAAWESAGYDTAGMGSLLAAIPGTKAKDMEALLDTLRANIGFDRLQQMREASITGGALGNVSNREIELLYNSLAPLDQKQSPAQLKRSLERVITVYERMERMGRDPELRDQLEAMDDNEYWSYWDSQGLGRNANEQSRRDAMRKKYG